MKNITVILSIFTILMPQLLTGVTNQHSTLEQLPKEGYYLAPESHVFDGLLFEENRLYIFIKSDADHLEDGQESLEFLKEFHSFPRPDFKQYNEDVAEVYMEDGNYDYDLKETYLEITDLITPMMSQEDVMNLINNRIPGIYYTEKHDFKYFTIASPTIIENSNTYTIRLFEEDIFTFNKSTEPAKLIDDTGTTYQYVAGFKPI